MRPPSACWLLVCVWLAAIAATQASAQQARPVVSDPAGRGAQAAALTERGERLVALGDPGSAVWFLREALRVEPAHAPAAVALARIYLSRDAPSSARDVLVQTLERAPVAPLLWLWLSRVLWAMGRTPDAMEALREGTRVAPTDVALWRELHDRSLARGDWLRALLALRTLRDLGAEVDMAQEAALAVWIGSSDRARGAGCDPERTTIRRALARCEPAPSSIRAEVRGFLR